MMKIKVIYPKEAELKPTNIAVSAARTCYFAGGLVEPLKSEGWGVKENLLSSIFEAGHHTTLQHAHFTLLIDGMSRHLIWRLLHSHPYYNSEQVSQRYAKMKSENFVYPKDGDNEVWHAYYERVFANYEKLSEKLKAKFEECLPKFKKKDAVKKAQEFARYVLPQGMGAYLYHTINLTVALRYIALAKELPEARKEGVEFASLLADELIAIDESLKPLVEYAKTAKANFADFDLAALKQKVGVKNEENVKLFDVVNPMPYTVNENYSDVLRLSNLSIDGASLGGFTSYMKLSFCADAQNQRHRRSVAVRPALEKYYKKEYYVPPIIAKDDELKAIYESAIQEAYEFFEQQRAQIGFGEAVYALPNAHMIEIVERSDMASFNHKAQMRLCFNAQEEIYDIIYEQARSLRKMGVEGAEKLLPPCTLRSEAGIHPICPEGPRFCGVKVWKKSFEELTREY
jgi:flavin-dependent thymidylate synthase